MDVALSEVRYVKQPERKPSNPAAIPGLSGGGDSGRFRRKTIFIASPADSGVTGHTIPKGWTAYLRERFCCDGWYSERTDRTGAAV